MYEHGTIMKKKAIIAASLLLILSASVVSTSVLAAPAQVFGGDSKKDTTRLLTGKVLDASDNPLPDAVVYLTNTHPRSV